MPTSALGLKGYFETGDKPTAAQFAELIDGNLNLNDGGTVTGNITLNGTLTRLTPQTIVDWNYIRCSAPLVGMSPTLGDGAGVTAAGAIYSILFPNEDGGVHSSNMTCNGAQSTTTMYPQMEGTIPATDDGTNAVGFNVQLDAESGNDEGMELQFGPMAGNNSNKFVVGTHTGHIDVTFWTSDFTDYDVAVVGFRKAEAFQSGFPGILAGGSGDPAYSDLFVAGVIGSARKIQTANALNGDTTVQIVDSTDVAADSDNLRIKVSLASDGAATFQRVVNAEAGAGTLANASGGTHTFSFDSGDTLVPFIATLKNGAADVELLIKDIEISRSPGVSITNY